MHRHTHSPLALASVPSIFAAGTSPFSGKKMAAQGCH